MTMGTADITDVLLPPDDGTILRALSELDTKVTAWVSTVADAQAAITRNADKCRAAEGSSEHHGETESASSASSGSINTPRDSAQDPHADAVARTHSPSRPQSESNARMDADEDTPSEDDAAKLRILRNAMAQDMVADDAAEAIDAEDSPESDESSNEIFDGSEALLMSLEPQMAKAIRIQYRMFNGRKSIQELIDDYEEPTDTRQPKSWWERVKG